MINTPNSSLLHKHRCTLFSLVLIAVSGCSPSPQSPPDNSLPQSHPIVEQLERGKALFEKSWTHQEGAGHRNALGVVDMNKAERMGSQRMNFELFATPAVTSCAACHNIPYSLPGGSGQMITNVIVVRKTQPQGTPLERINKDEVIVNASAPPSMFGSGYVEMLARQITSTLRAQRDSLQPGHAVELRAQDISFGTLRRDVDGLWDTSALQGLPLSSLLSRGAPHPPSLTIKPFHQTASIGSLREFTINAFDFHLGLQANERFGFNADPDRDGVVNELTAEQIDDIVAFQATLPAPIEAHSNDPSQRRITQLGKKLFDEFKCAECHRPSLMLSRENWVFKDYDINATLRTQIDLNAKELPGRRLVATDDHLLVPVYSDFKLHDITDGALDPDRDPLSLHTAAGSKEFFEGTGRFITTRLWGTGNQPPYFHNGRHTSLREAIEAHGGEAMHSRRAFRQSDNDDQNALLSFLESLQIEQPR